MVSVGQSGEWGEYDECRVERQASGECRPSNSGERNANDECRAELRVSDERRPKGEETIMEEGKFDSNEMKDNTDHADQDLSPSTVEEVKLPEIGMIFSSEEEIRTFYNSYATSVGFGISKLGGRNGDDGKQKYFSIGCAKNRKKVSQAKNALHPRPSSKTNCKAKINVAVRNDGNFVITSVDLEHNHLLSPGKSRHFRCNKVLDSATKRKLELNDQAGITLNKSFHSCVVEAGGYENLSFDERKCRNYISEARRLRHVIKVLMRMKVIEVPMSYIMNRWRKDIKRGYQSISNIYDGYGCSEKRLRYNTLTPLMQEVQQLGAESDEICSFLVEIMKDTKEKLIIAMENGQSRAGQFEEASTSEAKVIHSPLKVRTKGRPPTKRKQSKVEQIMNKSIAKGRKKDGDWDWRFAYGRVVWIMGFACWFAILTLVVHCGRKKLEYRVLPTLHIRVYELFD
ncbi:hypothetical protein ZIOFF_022848 [Zingiber officinale]|uniref:FAR1 domain-containing protein n=1 Tax=Zingiber officinale TaxID=94328 RepID=A0A8J5HMI7_ZINOF|nr:hypothetical protein ZIOFF_022848 [Zingiber officinale]